MAILFRCPKAVSLGVVAGWLVLAGHSMAAERSMNCNDKLPASHAQLAEGDQNSPNHLQLSRKVGLGIPIDLEVCAADLTILPKGGDLLQVTVDLGNIATKLTANDYLQALDVTPKSVRLKLHLPKSAQARVVIVIPAATSKLGVNLVHGGVSLEADRIAGPRMINVVHGHVDLLANPDAYATLHVSVLMGSFHNRRQGDDARPVMVSRSLTGTGRGSIEINVNRGSVDLKPWD